MRDNAGLVKSRNISMKSIQIHQYGGPEVLRRVDMPVPAAGPGTLLVRVHHVGINFMDIHTRQGKYETSQTYPVRLPCTLGMEARARWRLSGQR